MKFTDNKIQSKFMGSAPDGFNDYLEEFGPDLSGLLPDYIKDVVLAKNYDVYVSKYLYEPLLKYLKNPGKMHRPLTCIAAYFACGGSAESDEFASVVDVALSIELFQAAALIHDDIADEAQLRRGEPCMHCVEGEPIALNAGDFALSAVEGQLISSFNCGEFSFCAEKTLRILHEISQMEYRTIDGQAIDLGWARDCEFGLNVEDYFNMARHKTAYYSAAVPCVLGAICADANDETIEQLRDFGMHIGLAFQIQDDLLNLVGNDTSKDFRSDIVEGKRTLMAVYALNNASKDDKVMLRRILESAQNSEEEKADAVEIMKACGALKYSEEKSHELAVRAHVILQNSLPDSKWKSVLSDMCTWCTTRNK